MEKARALLRSVNRPGMNELINYMESTGYFSAPASVKFHGSYEGGLRDHSLNLYELLKTKVGIFQIQDKISEETMILTALLHDICKVNQYVKIGNKFKTNKENAQGHAKLSLYRIQRFIKLTPLEIDMIKYHMGIYGTHEFLDMHQWSKGKGEYTIREYTGAINNPLVKMFYFCDDEVSQFVDNNTAQ